MVELEIAPCSVDSLFDVGSICSSYGPGEFRSLESHIHELTSINSVFQFTRKVGIHRVPPTPLILAV